MMVDKLAEFTIERNGDVCILTFDRPEFGNALTRAATGPLTDCFQTLATEPHLGALLIRGRGEHFCAGGDIRGFGETLNHPPEHRREAFRDRMKSLAVLVKTFFDLDIPIVAVCQGAVAGAGMTYALGADLVLADETVRFMFAHQRMGLSPDGGMTLLLPRAVGERKAVELLLTAANVQADEALRLGLVSRLVPAADLQAEGLKAAQRLASAPRNVVRRTKRLMRGAPKRSPSEQLEAEREAIVESVGEADFEEGVEAFLERRRAMFPSAVSP